MSPVPVNEPLLDGNEKKYLLECIETGWISSEGPFIKEFEQKFAARVGRKHGVAVCNGTAALDAAVDALGIGPGDEVILPAFTIISCIGQIVRAGARPVLVDSDPVTWNMDVGQLEAKITPRTRAIMAVHIYGLPVDMDPLLDLARRHGLKVIEDAAEMHGQNYKGRPCGSLGDISTFSFYPNKHVTTGEGGMIVTNNDAIAERCRIMALHGISKDAWKRYTAEGSWYYEIIAPGYKYNMTDVAAAMGLAQLAKVERMAARRQAIAQTYNAAFADLSEVQTPLDPEQQRPSACQGCDCAQENIQCSHAWHLYMLRLHLERLSIDRARFIELLKAHNIGASVHFIPLHLHPYYRETYGYCPQDYPVAYAEYLREISLPIYSKMSDEDVNDVITAVRTIIAEYRR